MRTAPASGDCSVIMRLGGPSFQGVTKVRFPPKAAMDVEPNAHRTSSIAKLTRRDHPEPAAVGTPLPVHESRPSCERKHDASGRTRASPATQQRQPTMKQRESG